MKSACKKENVKPSQAKPIVWDINCEMHSSEGNLAGGALPPNPLPEGERGSSSSFPPSICLHQSSLTSN